MGKELIIRKYIEGEVIESNFMETESRPVTEIITSKITRGIERMEANSNRTSNNNVEINNLHLINYIDTGILYKDLAREKELAILGSREISMPLLSNNRKKLKVITPPMYVSVSGNGNVKVSLVSDTLNPYTNVFSDIQEFTLRDKHSNRFSFRLYKICLGNELASKMSREYRRGIYGALDILVDWLVSTPNNDLSLNAWFSAGKFNRYIQNSVSRGLVNKEQLIRISDMLTDTDLGTRNSGMTHNYDLMIVLHNAITVVAPNIAGDFIGSSFATNSNDEFSIDEIREILANNY